MPRRNSTPDVRAAEGKKKVDRIRRKYKVDVNKRKKLLPAEEPHVAQMVVVLKLAGYNRIQIAKAVGISRQQVTEFLDKPEVTEQLVRLRAALPTAAIELLQGLMIEAVVAIADVMRTSEDDKYVLAAAGEILDRAGVPKASRQERHTVNEERTTITDDGLLERLREAPVEVQEEAAQIIERLENLLAVAAESGEEGDDETSE